MTPNRSTQEPDKEQLVQQAVDARERLFKSVEALDRKRHQLTHPIATVNTMLGTGSGNRKPALLGLGAVVGMATVAAIIVHRRRARAASHVEARRTFWRGVATQVGVALAAWGIMRVSERALRSRSSPP